MNSKQLKERWNDERFISEMKPALNSVFVDKQSDSAFDLRGIPIGVEESPPFLYDKNLYDANLSGQQFSYSKFSCSFSDCNLSKIDFSFSVFDTCSICRGHFIDCIFDSIKLRNTLWDDVSFNNCTFKLAKIVGAGPIEYGGGKRATFKSCKLSNCTFKYMQIK